MKVILFGASGMIGQGVLRECLLDPEVQAVLSVGRTGSDLAVGGAALADLRERGAGIAVLVLTDGAGDDRRSPRVRSSSARMRHVGFNP